MHIHVPKISRTERHSTRKQVLALQDSDISNACAHAFDEEMQQRSKVRVRVRPESPKAARLGLRQGPYLHVCTNISRGHVTRIKIGIFIHEKHPLMSISRRCEPVT